MVATAPPAGANVPAAFGAAVDHARVCALIDVLAPLTPEERLRWNDHVVAELMATFERLRHDRGP